MLAKFQVIKIDEKDKKNAQKPFEPADIIGPVKTVLRHVNAESTNKLSPAEKESLRQRTNQPLKIDAFTGQDEQKKENKQGKNRLKM